MEKPCPLLPCDEENIDSLIESWDATNETTTRENLLVLVKTTTRAILHLNWQKLKPETRKNLTTALQNRSNFNDKPRPLISSLIDLSTIDSCRNSALAALLYDQTDKNLENYCAATSCDVLCVQMRCLSQTGSEKFALKLCECCLNLKKPKMDSGDKFRDLYSKFLFQSDQLVRLTSEIPNLYTRDKGIEFVDRILASSDNDALLFASCVLQIFLARNLLSQENRSDTKNLMKMWINIHRKLDSSSHLLREQVTLLARTFATSAHCYSFADLLFSEFGDKLLESYVELYVKGLIVDLNVLENARSEQRGTKRLQVNFANVLCNLAEIVGNESFLARECFLSAFSVDPTAVRLRLLGEFGAFCGSCHCLVRGACAQLGTKSRERESQIDRLSDGILGDLLIVLSEPRNRILTWEMQWTELKKQCEMHLAASKNKVRKTSFKERRRTK